MHPMPSRTLKTKLKIEQVYSNHLNKDVNILFVILKEMKEPQVFFLVPVKMKSCS